MAATFVLVEFIHPPIVLEINDLRLKVSDMKSGAIPRSLRLSLRCSFLSGGSSLDSRESNIAS
jgi:hypothetical protein